MTLEEMKLYPRAYLVPAQVAAVLGMSAQTVRMMARAERLPFPAIVTRSRVRIPTKPFIAYMEGKKE